MRISVRVIPRSKKAKIQPFKDGLKIHILEPALDGRANKGLIEALAEYYKVKKSTISIIRGLKQKDKIIEINEIS